MRLLPVDIEVLRTLDQRGRDVAANLAVLLEYDRSYLNQRFRLLIDAGLVERVGPAEDTGLYELTAAGRKRLAEYDRQIEAARESAVSEG